MKPIYLIYSIVIMNFVFLGCNQPSEKQETPTLNTYSPRYWLEGAIDHRATYDQPTLKNKMRDVKENGWDGIVYWGANRKGEGMEYYFESPFLENQSWAEPVNQNFSSIMETAHENNLKVMLNIEGVNPYHWESFKWTPENIAEVANDLAKTEVDAVFEECFEVEPEIFLSLARSLKKKGIVYISGTDPMLLREPNFVRLWPETGIINIYNYYLKRDKRYNIATLAQNGSLGLGWAKYWDKPTSMISPLTRNWGISMKYSPAIVSYLSLIRALQFRLDNFIIFGGADLFNPKENEKWIKKYVNRQEKDRPLLNIVVLLGSEDEIQNDTALAASWNKLFNSGDAITSGAFNAGYNIVVSDKPIKAEAYWIYGNGGASDSLPQNVVDLFDTDKPVFLQVGKNIPSGHGISNNWGKVLDKCGIDGSKPFSYVQGKNHTSASLPSSQEEELPYTGYYKDQYLRFTGTDNQRGMDLRTGTIIPKEAITGEVIATPNATYGKSPFIVGKNQKYVVTLNSLSWEVSAPISDLLSGHGILPTSNVWGIVGKNVSALLAIEATKLEMTIPGLKKGSEITVEIWDKNHSLKSTDKISYSPPFTQFLDEYDFVIIQSSLPQK